MKIIKKGVKPPVEVLRGTCKICGCEIEVDSNETGVGRINFGRNFLGRIEIERVHACPGPDNNFYCAGTIYLNPLNSTV